MDKFWKYHVRYRLSRRLIHMGLFVMPEGRYKDNLISDLWRRYDEVMVATMSAELRPNAPE